MASEYRLQVMSDFRNEHRDGKAYTCRALTVDRVQPCRWGFLETKTIVFLVWISHFLWRTSSFLSSDSKPKANKENSRQGDVHPCLCDRRILQLSIGVKKSLLWSHGFDVAGEHASTCIESSRLQCQSAGIYFQTSRSTRDWLLFHALLLHVTQSVAHAWI